MIEQIYVRVRLLLDESSVLKCHYESRDILTSRRAGTAREAQRQPPATSTGAGSTESATPIQVDGEDDKFESYMKQFNFERYVLKLRAKADTWNEQTRVKVSIAVVKPCDYKAESAALVQALA